MAKLNQSMWKHEPRKKVDISTSRDAIAFTGDWHVGSKGVNYPQLLEDLQELVDGGLGIVLMGDLIDARNKNSPGWDLNLMEPDEQLQQVQEVVGMLGDNVVAALMGCHEDWLRKNAGIDVFNAVLGDLPYLGKSGIVHAGDKTIGVAHKHRGGRTRRHTYMYDAVGPLDAVVMGHYHYPELRLTMPKQGKGRWYASSGTYKMRDPFIEKYNATPGYRGTPVYHVDLDVMEMIHLDR